MGNTRRAILAVVSVSVLSSTLFAGPGGPRPLAGLAKEADAIVVGRVAAVSALQRGVQTTVDILRVHKGALVDGERVQVVFTKTDLTEGGRQSAGIVGLWFLKAGDGGQWEVMPPVVGDVSLSMTYLPVSADPPGGAYWVSPDMQPFDKVICEVASALERSGRNSALEMLVTTGAFGPPTTTVARKVWAELAASTNSAVRSLGLDVLIKGGDAPSLTRLASDPEIAAGLTKPSRLATAVCDFRNSSDEAVALLGGLTKAGLPSWLRVCAAHSLRAMHTQGALPILAVLLDADSADLRYEGVLGLASFANGLPAVTGANVAAMAFAEATVDSRFATEETRRNMPALPAFERDEARYVNFWKSWWEIHRAELMN